MQICGLQVICFSVLSQCTEWIVLAGPIHWVIDVQVLTGKCKFSLNSETALPPKPHHLTPSYIHVTAKLKIKHANYKEWINKQNVNLVVVTLGCNAKISALCGEIVKHS